MNPLAEFVLLVVAVAIAYGFSKALYAAGARGRLPEPLQRSYDRDHWSC